MQELNTSIGELSPMFFYISIATVCFIYLTMEFENQIKDFVKNFISKKTFLILNNVKHLRNQTKHLARTPLTQIGKVTNIEEPLRNKKNSQNIQIEDSKFPIDYWTHLITDESKFVKPNKLNSKYLAVNKAGETILKAKESATQTLEPKPFKKYYKHKKVNKTKNKDNNFTKTS